MLFRRRPSSAQWPSKDTHTQKDITMMKQKLEESRTTINISSDTITNTTQPNHHFLPLTPYFIVKKRKIRSYPFKKKGSVCSHHHHHHLSTYGPLIFFCHLSHTYTPAAAASSPAFHTLHFNSAIYQTPKLILFLDTPADRHPYQCLSLLSF